jgi:PAS domain S-box-containing protein
MNEPEQPRRSWHALRDLLVISLALVAVFWVGAATNLFEGAHTWLAEHAPGKDDEIVFGLALACLGLGLLGARLWRTGRREARGRADAEVRFRRLVEQLPAVVSTWDPRRAGRRAQAYVSPQVRPILGGPPEGWRRDGDRWLEPIHPEDRELVAQAVERAQRTESSVAVEYRYRRPDGDQIWVREEILAVEHDGDGRASLMRSLLTDVTEQRRSAEQLAEAETRYRTLVERVPAVTYLWEGTIGSERGPASYISPQVQQLLGHTQEEFDDPDLWWRLLHPDDVERVTAEWTACG